MYSLLGLAVAILTICILLFYICMFVSTSKFNSTRYFYPHPIFTAHPTNAMWMLFAIFG